MLAAIQHKKAIASANMSNLMKEENALKKRMLAEHDQLQTENYAQQESIRRRGNAKRERRRHRDPVVGEYHDNHSAQAGFQNIIHQHANQNAHAEFQKYSRPFEPAFLDASQIVPFTNGERQYKKPRTISSPNRSFDAKDFSHPEEHPGTRHAAQELIRTAPIFSAGIRTTRRLATHRQAKKIHKKKAARSHKRAAQWAARKKARVLKSKIARISRSRSRANGQPTPTVLQHVLPLVVASKKTNAAACEANAAACEANAAAKTLVEEAVASGLQKEPTEQDDENDDLNFGVMKIDEEPVDIVGEEEEEEKEDTNYENAGSITGGNDEQENSVVDDFGDMADDEGNFEYAGSLTGGGGTDDTEDEDTADDAGPLTGGTGTTKKKKIKAVPTRKSPRQHASSARAASGSPPPADTSGSPPATTSGSPPPATTGGLPTPAPEGFSSTSANPGIDLSGTCKENDESSDEEGQDFNQQEEMMKMAVKQNKILQDLMNKSRRSSIGLKKPKMNKFCGDKNQNGTNLIDWLVEYRVATQGQSDNEIISMVAHYIAGPEYFRRAVMEMSENFNGTWEEFKLKIILVSFKNRNGYAALHSSYMDYIPVEVRPGQYGELARLLKNLINLRDVLAQMRGEPIDTEGDFVRRFLLCIKTATVRAFLMDKMMVLHGDDDDLVPNNTIAQLRRACLMWSRVQEIPSNTYNLVTGNTIADDEEKMPSGKFLKARAKPDQEITRTHRETSSTRTQVFGADSDSDEDYEDVAHDQPKKKRRYQKDDEEKGMLKNIFSIVSNIAATPAPTPPSYPPPQQPAQQQQFQPNPPQNPQQGTTTKPPFPYRTRTGSEHCSFCRLPFVAPPNEHYIICPLILSNERRCAHFKEGCPEKFAIPLGPRDDKKANVGKPYAQHLAVCKFHKCRQCARSNHPSQHSNLRCPNRTCGLCNKKGHADYLCHEC